MQYGAENGKVAAAQSTLDAIRGTAHDGHQEAAAEPTLGVPLGSIGVMGRGWPLESPRLVPPRAPPTVGIIFIYNEIFRDGPRWAHQQQPQPDTGQ